MWQSYVNKLVDTDIPLFFILHKVKIDELLGFMETLNHEKENHIYIRDIEFKCDGNVKCVQFTTNISYQYMPKF